MTDLEKAYLDRVGREEAKERAEEQAYLAQCAAWDAEIRAECEADIAAEDGGLSAEGLLSHPMAPAVIERG